MNAVEGSHVHDACIGTIANATQWRVGCAQVVMSGYFSLSEER